MTLSHPDLDIFLAVATLAPFIYFGVRDGVAKRKKKPITLPAHPFRRSGDDYARYFYIANTYLGIDSFIGSLPKIGGVPHAILATLALKLIVAKGEQCDYARRKKAKMS